MISYQSVCDEFYVSFRVHTKLDLNPSRETVLHFFESLQRVFPGLSRLRSREDGSLILEEPDEREVRRWVRLDQQSLRLGLERVEDLARFEQFARTVLDLAIPSLSLSTLDYDNWETVFGFDLEYQGNHDDLIGTALLGPSPLQQVWDGDGVQAIDCQPFLGASLTPQCDLQAYVEVKSRTSTFEVRTQDFERSSVTVLLTVRKYWGFPTDGQPGEVVTQLVRTADEWAAGKVVPLVVQPLAQAIASRR